MSEQDNSGQDIYEELTERELEILQLLAGGASDRKIANDLILSVDTVKWYNKRIYSKLSVNNRTQAVQQATQLGLLQAPQRTTQSMIAASPRHNLPASTLPFVGRDLELKDIIDILADEHVRLLTIHAIGGMGKTRLALQVAKSQVATFKHGVFFIPLAQLRSSDAIIPTIAEQLDVQLTSSQNPLGQLANSLDTKEMLLVLDNFEHLLDGVDLITALLQAAPRLKILITSRERLNLRGETVYALGGMSLPAHDAKDHVLASSAVDLFLQRMQMTQSNIRLTDDNLKDVSKICQLVKGMPLGIELAAGLIELLSPKEIAAEIEHNYSILATEMRDMPQRLRSIRAVFDYSWSRLTEEQRDIYMRLAVFRDGFTREAAHTIAGADLTLLLGLINKSLIQRDSERGRFLIHELLRQYAEDHLQQSEQEFSTLVAYKDFYTNLLKDCGTRIKTPQQSEALDAIDADFENIRAAWQLAVHQHDDDAINHSLEAIYWFCNIRARVPSGETLLKLARDQLGVEYSLETHPIRRRLLLRFDKSGEEFGKKINKMLALVNQGDDDKERALFLWMQGVNYYVDRHFDDAVHHLKEAHQLFVQLEDTFYQAEALHLIYICNRFLGILDENDVIATQIRMLARKSGNKFALGRALGSQGLLALYEGNLSQAEDDLEEAIAIRSELGDRAGVAVSLSSMSQAVLYQGDILRAKELAQDGLQLASENNSRFPLGVALGILSWLASIEDDYDTAWELASKSLTVLADPNASFPAYYGTILASIGQGNLETAKEHFQLLGQSRGFWFTPRGMTLMLPIISILFRSNDKLYEAVIALACAVTHPHTATLWLQDWDRLIEHQQYLEHELGSQKFQEAWDDGTQADAFKLFNDWHEAI